jgi:hypothetical protein
VTGSQSVSRAARYVWSCACGSQNDSLVWEILHLGEHPEFLGEDGFRNLSVVYCASCAAAHAVDATVLVLNPGSSVDLLLGLPQREDSAAAERLLQDAAASDGGGAKSRARPFPCHDQSLSLPLHGMLRRMRRK